jgi:enterochelin esterase-like enzyme
VIYLITMPAEQRLDQTAMTPMSLADRLIRNRRMAPVILIIPDDTIGYGYHLALAIDLIPYVDAKFNTLTDKKYRGVGGVSHGAAIAARMAFQFSETFGSLGVLSGGIDAGERSTFDLWITSSKDHPRVLINVGDQDGIMSLTQNLLDVLESKNIPYELRIDPGGHNWDFWSAHMESYLLWFAQAWQSQVPDLSTKHLCLMSM